MIDVIYSEIHKGLPIGKACISVAMYSTVPCDRVGGKVAQVIEHFMKFAPGALHSQFVPGDYDEDDYGYTRDFDEAAATQLFKELNEETKYYSVDLSGGHDREPTGYGIRFYGAPLDEKSSPVTNFLRLDVPVPGSKQEIAGLLNFAAKSFEIYPAFAGTCGLSFNYDIGFESEIRPQITALVMRYLGFDIAYDFMNYEMKGKCPPPHWLTFVGVGLLAKFGGRTVLSARLGDTPVRELAGGVLIQAVARPPVGDVNRRARDIGALPKIWRLLKPLLFDRDVDYGFEDPEQERRWLARFDNLEDQPWDNWAIDGPASPTRT